MIELERKFLVPEAPPYLERCRWEPIEQAYLAVTDDGWEFRVRRIGDGTVLTVKHGAGERRVEEEVDIPEGQFQSLWSLTDRRLSKRRHYVVDGDSMIEVDVYEGSLEGLVVAEVEFESQREADAFQPPDWFAEEVTEDRRYSNQQLALRGAPSRRER
jgi:adenylate cyclase